MAAVVYNLDQSNMSLSAVLPGSILQCTHSKEYSQTGTIAAATEYFRVVRGATGTVLSLQAAITEAIATGGDRTVTLDLKKSTGAGAFASILSATLVFNSSSTLRLYSSATVSTTGLVAGDILQLTVAVAGAAGAQATGLCASVTWREAPA